MLVVVKAFSRPFYLDRCLTSIRANVDGADGVVVLDDGLLPEAVDRLRQRHPDVVFMRSPWAAEKPMVVRRTLKTATAVNPRQSSADQSLDRLADMVFRGLSIPPDMDPLPFWRESIAALDSDNIFLIEEDCWLHTHLDLAAIDVQMHQHDVLVCHMFLQKRFASAPLLGAVGEAVTMELINVPRPVDRNIAPDTYFPVCLAIYDRAYWLACHETAASFLPEWPIHAHAVDVVDQWMRQGRRCGFARLTPGPIRHGFSLSSLVPPSHYGAEISLYDISDLLTESWLTGALGAMDDFPDDFAETRLTTLVAQRLGPKAAALLVEFRRAFAGYYDYLDRKPGESIPPETPPAT